MLVQVALTLEQPFRVLTIMKEVLGMVDGEEQLKTTILKLRQDQLNTVLKYSLKVSQAYISSQNLKTVID